MIKKVKLSKSKTADNEDLAELFNSLLSPNGANLTIAYPKYKNLCTTIDKVAKLMKIMAEIKCFQLADYKHFMDDAKIFVREIGVLLGECGNVVIDSDSVSDEVKAAFVKNYNTLKESKIVKILTIICDKLEPYKKVLTMPEPPTNWLNGVTGLKFEPLKFSPLNLYMLFLDDRIPETNKDLITRCMGKLYQMTYNIYNTIITPDIDIDEFIYIVRNAIEKLRTRPELSRCGKAFSKILQSLDLLKENFNGYYRDFINTQQGTIIMEHFILDISKTTEADPVLTHQFRQIISFYRKQAALIKHKDPLITKLCNDLDKKYEEINAELENLNKTPTNQ